MNKKTIKKILKGKFTRWVKTIEDETVRKLVEKNTIITGGSIVSLLTKETVKDYDIYFRNKETVLAVANYYCNKFNELNPNRQNKLGKDIRAYVLDCDDQDQIKREEEECCTAGNRPGHLYNLEEGRVKIVVRSDGVIGEDEEMTDNQFDDVYDVLEQNDQIEMEDVVDLTKQAESDKKPPYRPVFLSSNAITLSDKIQLVIRFYGDPEEIHKNYDFVHCTNYWTSWDNTLTLRQEALEAIMAKELRYSGSKYPICSIIRTRKFIKRGWHINAGQYLKMAYQVAQLDLNDINVLEDQLVGVDSAYFGILINALRKKHEENGDFTAHESYVTELIDRIF